MINYKFRLGGKNERRLVDLWALAEHLEGADAPLPVWEVTRPVECNRLSVRFRALTGRLVLVNFFHSGKVNILGADSPGTAETIYGYLTRLFVAEWSQLVRLRPRPDSQRT